MNLVYLMAAIAILLPSASCITCTQGMQSYALSNLTALPCPTDQVCFRFDATITVPFPGAIPGKKLCYANTERMKR